MSRTLPRALALTASALALALTTSACSLLSFGPRTLEGSGFFGPFVLRGLF